MAEISETNNKIMVDSLLRIPFFRGVSTEALTAVSARLRQAQYQHDEVVFAQGTFGDAMYLIESGQVRISITTEPDQPEKVITYLGPGNFFGEMALILNQRRTATVTVTIDADLWVLYKADLDDLLVDHPEISLQITRELSRRLSNSVAQTARRHGFQRIAGFGIDVWRLAESIYNLTHERVVLFDATGRSLANLVSPDFQHDRLIILEAMSDLSSETYAETLGILADGYDWVIVALPEQYSEVAAKVLKFTEATVLCNTSSEAWIMASSPGPVFVSNGTQKEIDRAARKVTHRVVGLALSSGGARGIAHIGVLETLEKANIPVDMIAGTSAGSLFGGLYALGKTVDEVANFARNLVKLIEFKSGLWDPKFKLPWNGLIKGNATLKYLDKQFNNANFKDTTIPFYVVAADVFSGEEVVFESGPIAEAVRASIGMIGIFSPYQLNHHYLIDGGAVNPVPASILAEKGANLIIASSVIPSIEEERARGQTTVQQHNPNFLGVLSSMMAIMEREIVKTRMSAVDVLIKPKVEALTAMDYHRTDDFLQLGREAATKEMPLLKKLFDNMSRQ